MSEPHPSHFVVGLPAPMPFGMTLERIYHLVRSHLRLFLAIGSVIAAGLLLVYLAFGGREGFGFSGMSPKSTNPDPAQMMRCMTAPRVASCRAHAGGICALSRRSSLCRAQRRCSG